MDWGGRSEPARLGVDDSDALGQCAWREGHKRGQWMGGIMGPISMLTGALSLFVSV